MQACQTDIIASLRQEILSHQGYKPGSGRLMVNAGLASILKSFPNEQIPLSSVHEFICANPETLSSTNGFIAAMLSSFMLQGGACLWISTDHKTFPVSLPLFGIQPHRIIFVHVPKEKDVLWVTEEALKCNSLAAVIAETKELSFTASRRLQLAVEQSCTIGFLLRTAPKQLTPNACTARWAINPIPSELPPGMPGVGFPRWKIKLLKVRNGKPGEWDLEWNGKMFIPVNRNQQTVHVLHKKAG